MICFLNFFKFIFSFFAPSFALIAIWCLVRRYVPVHCHYHQGKRRRCHNLSMAAAPTLIAATSQKLQDTTTEGDVVFTKAERELLKGSHSISITVKYGRKQMTFSVIRVGLTRDFIFRQITGPWNLEEVEFSRYSHCGVCQGQSN